MSGVTAPLDLDAGRGAALWRSRLACLEALRRVSPALPGAASPAGEASLGEDLEAQRPGDGRGLDQLHLHLVAETIGFTRVVAAHGVGSLVVAVVIVTDGGRRNEAVRAGLLQLDEEPRLCHPRDLSTECGPDPVGKEVRDQAVDCLTLRRHGAALRRRDLGA